MSKRKLKGKTLKRSSTKVKTKRKAEKLHIINTDFQTSLIFHILRVILRNVFGCTPDEEVQISKVFSKVGKIWKANGIAFTIKYMKSVRLHCTRYMVGDPLVQREELPIKVSLDGDMFPVILADFKHLFKSQRRWDVVKGLTLSSISRSFKRYRFPLRADFSSITSPSRAIITELDPKLVKKVVSNMKLPKLEIKDWTGLDHKIFCSAGPHGISTENALVSLNKYKAEALRSLKSLVGSWGKSYIDKEWGATLVDLSSASLSALLGSKPITQVHTAATFDQWIEGRILQTQRSPFIRRLGIVEDPELKARVIGMFDHFSQAVLDLTSEQVYKMLKKIPSDRTYTQDPRMDHKGVTQNDSKYWSMDLTNATDRFPIQFQVQVLEALGFTKAQAAAWKYLMVGEPFLYPGHPAEWDELDSLTYNVGQPMGGRSSWPIFTLSHHILVRAIAHQLGMPNFHDYIILGDDIVIKNDSVAKVYMKMMHKFGVELSEAKTHVSSTHYEFAKRWMSDIGEVSPIPLPGIVDNFRNIGIIFQIFYELIVTRGLIQFQSGTFSAGFAKMYYELRLGLQKHHKIYPYFKFKKVKLIRVQTILEMIYPFISLLRYRDKLQTYEELRKYFCRHRTCRGDKDVIIAPDYSTLREECQKRLVKVLKDLLDKASEKANNIRNQPDPSNQPLLLGFRSLQFKLLNFVTEFNSNPDVNLKEMQDILLSYDNPLLAREGSSKAKTMNNFNRFARLVDKSIKLTPLDFGKIKYEPPKELNSGSFGKSSEFSWAKFI
jgi:hypothetical protein